MLAGLSTTASHMVETTSMQRESKAADIDYYSVDQGSRGTLVLQACKMGKHSLIPTTPQTRGIGRVY